MAAAHINIQPDFSISHAEAGGFDLGALSYLCGAEDRAARYSLANEDDLTTIAKRLLSRSTKYRI